MDLDPNRMENFEQRVHAAPESERMTFILTELICQMIELNASLNNIDKQLRRVADALGE